MSKMRQRLGPICIAPGCNRKPVSKQVCSKHYWAFRKKGLIPAPICKIDECERTVHAKGFCGKHYHRWRKHGDPLFSLLGERGEGWIDTGGYKRMRQNGKTVLEHRAVMEKILGRPLLQDESIHHKNGDRLDNRPCNLEIWTSFQPPGQKVEDKLRWAQEIIGRYGDDLVTFYEAADEL